MTDGPFLVQCVSGKLEHVMEAIPGTELEELCRQRAKNGFIDALRLGYEECPDCVEDTRTRARNDAEYLAMAGCPAADNYDICKDDCFCKNRKVIADSPFADQVQYITQLAFAA